MKQYKRAYIGGTFDLFHEGHVNLLKQAKILQFWTVVALNSDDFAASYKRKPVMNERERLAVLQACKYVDNVFIMESNERQPYHLDRLRPDYIIHGDDWKGDSLASQLNITDEFMQERGIEFYYLPYTKGISTSDIMQRMLDSNVS
jgi:glycerol-3-phosphate cytidylyltransferase